MGEVLLNASALSEYDLSLHIVLTTKFSLPEDSTETSVVLKFMSLIDSGSTDSFIDSTYISRNDILTEKISPINLRLFDGSLAPSAITETVSLSVRFPTGELLPLKFYVTPLDSSCKAVLGYSFLTCYNLLIDWASKTISFQNSKQPVSTQMSPLVDCSLCSLKSLVTSLLTGSLTVTLASSLPHGNHSCLKPCPLSEKFPYEPIYSYPSVAQMASHTEMSDMDVDITFVSAAAFHQICKGSGVQPILLHAIHSEVLA